MLSPLQMHVGPRALVSTRLLGRELPSSTFSLEPERQEPLASEGRCRQQPGQVPGQGTGEALSSPPLLRKPRGQRAGRPNLQEAARDQDKCRNNGARWRSCPTWGCWGPGFAVPVRSLQHRDPPAALVVEEGLLPRELRLVGGCEERGAA